MNYGLYLSAAGAVGSMHRQSVAANNLANMNTVGFKPDQVFVKQRLPERLEDPALVTDPKLMLEQLGGGLFMEPTHTTLTQGGVVASGNDLDLAIEGDGLFVVGRGRQPEDMRLTRDGRFTINPRGELVMASNGLHVQPTHGRSIRLDRNAPVRIDNQGAVHQNGKVVAELRIMAPRDAAAITKVGDNLYRLADGVTPRDGSFGSLEGRIRQGFTEASAVDPIITLNNMIGAAKSAQANLRLMQYHDQILGQAFNTFGRVA